MCAVNIQNAVDKDCLKFGSKELKGFDLVTTMI